MRAFNLTQVSHRHQMNGLSHSSSSRSVLYPPGASIQIAIHSSNTPFHKQMSSSIRSTSLSCLSRMNQEDPLLHPFNSGAGEQSRDSSQQESRCAPRDRGAKVTVVGVGNVGMACAQTILTQELAEELALVDINPDKLRGEMLDLQHSAGFLSHRAAISASTDYSISANSDIVVITAGARQREGETRLDLTARNAALFSHIVPEIVRYSPDTILLVVTNPVDVLTWLSWKLAGGALPANRVIGSGTNLDTSRLRFLIGEHLGVNVRDVQAYVLGEHGDTSVPVWSGVSVAGRFFTRSFVQQELEEIHRAVVESAYEVIKLKGYTSWAIGYSAASLVRNLLRDERRICPASVLAKGYYGIEEEVFLSLPVHLGRSGVVSVVNSPLSEDEVDKLRSSSRTIFEIQQNLNLKL